MIEFGNTTSFGDGANDDTESFGLDAVHELLEARTLGIALDFGRNADLIGEGNEYEVTTGEEISQVMRGPLVEMGSLTICTNTS